MSEQEENFSGNPVTQNGQGPGNITEENLSRPEKPDTVEETVASTPSRDETEGNQITEEPCVEEVIDWENRWKELNDQYLRLYAEFDNYKKRMARERAEFVKMAGREVILAFLPVLDDFERAVKSMESSSDLAAVKEGIQLIFKKFQDVLERMGVKPADCCGEPFDPEKHEAVARVPAGPDKSGIVVDMVERGYLLHDRVLRFPKVVVGE
ncbi:MAG: nucleotide exchange factor GrpE [Flavobacteriales bacterium]|nr:nucleotide exchange factor GrpE [Flavobacteriales bacterium]